MNKIVLSLFDLTGAWSYPYKKDGYEVIQVDIQFGIDILTFKSPTKVHGILAAPPCTDFSVIGNCHWKRKDKDGSTEYSLKLIHKTLDIIEQTRPQWWCLENPIGRLPRLCPRLGMYNFIFHPYEYAGWCDHPEGEAYTKRTCLWGHFRLPEKKPIPPKFTIVSSGNRKHQNRLPSIEIQGQRSRTPQGFSKAFKEANP